MTISSLVSAGTAPTADTDIWAAPLALQANWKNPVTVRTNFETRIEHGQSVSEQRRILRSTPKRSISCTLTGLDRVESLAARQLINRRSIAGFLMPLYSDQMVLQATAAASATVLSVDPDLRRIFVGKRVMVLAIRHGVVTDFEVHEVAAVTASTSITLTGGGLASEALAGSLVIPLMETRLVGSYNNGIILSDNKADFQNYTAHENVGPTQLTGLETIGDNPTGFDTFNGLPVFDGPIDYNQIRYSINRIGSTSKVGLDELPVYFGERGLQKFSMLLQCTSRQLAWDSLRFFESRGGRGYPFYLRSPLADYNVVSVGASLLTVEDTGELLDWQYRPYLAMELADGSFDYREIDTVIQMGNNHQISFVAGGLLGNVVGARQLFLTRFFRDEIAERWLSPDRCQITFEMQELLEEKAIDLAEVLVTDDGDNIVTDNDEFLELGIFVGFEATTTISPDLLMCGIGGIAATGNRLLVSYDHTTAAPDDFFLALFDGDGVRQWEVTYTDLDIELGAAQTGPQLMSSDSSGGIYLFGPTHISGSPANTGTVYKFDSSGNLVWSTGVQKMDPFALKVSLMPDFANENRIAVSGSSLVANGFHVVLLDQTTGSEVKSWTGSSSDEIFNAVQVSTSKFVTAQLGGSVVQTSAHGSWVNGSEIQIRTPGELALEQVHCVARVVDNKIAIGGVQAFGSLKGIRIWDGSLGAQIATNTDDSQLYLFSPAPDSGIFYSYGLHGLDEWSFNGVALIKTRTLVTAWDVGTGPGHGHTSTNHSIYAVHDSSGAGERILQIDLATLTESDSLITATNASKINCLHHYRNI